MTNYSTISAETLVKTMTDRMFNRGPDASGFWTSKDKLVSLGHRRLSIVDLTDKADQPIYSDDGRFVIIFNGELYNYKELRIELVNQGYLFKTHSDTEVILALYIYYGQDMLSKLRGMFAFAILDTLSDKLFLARDPYGIKPLYIAKTKYGILFASQVKALLATNIISREPDIQGQASFWMLGSVSEPMTWFKHISAIPSGSYVEISTNNYNISYYKFANISKFWCPGGKFQSKPVSNKNIKRLLMESMKYHLVSDVPIAVLLSGGVDSSALIGLMIDCGIKNITGITICYDEFKGSSSDETPGASLIAKYYGIKHHVRRVTKEEFYSDMPLILDSMDQPTIDGINTWYASKAVAECGIKVALSGIGGDELFFGYKSFKLIPPFVKVMKSIDRVPGGRVITNFVAAIKSHQSNNLRWKYAPVWGQTIEGAWWLSRSIHTPEEVSRIMSEYGLHRGINEFNISLDIYNIAGDLSNYPKLAIAQLESMSYLRNQLLRDSDWASMSHSVEIRAPLVDYHLLKNLSPFLNWMSKYQKKELLANSPDKNVPRHVVHKSKTGFGIPVNTWIQELAGNNNSAAKYQWMNYVVNSYNKWTP